MNPFDMIGNLLNKAKQAQQRRLEQMISDEVTRQRQENPAYIMLSSAQMAAIERGNRETKYLVMLQSGLIVVLFAFIGYAIFLADANNYVSRAINALEIIAGALV